MELQFVVSVDGMGREASTVINRLGEKLTLKWSKPYSTVSEVEWPLLLISCSTINCCISGCIEVNGDWDLELTMVQG